jgi:hypothetical protein
MPTTLDLFLIDQDETILAMWNAGADLEQIAAACGTSPVRAAHDVNRVLNKQTVGMNFAKMTKVE